MKLSIFLLILFSSFQITNLVGQSTQTISFNDKQYTKIDGTWNVFDPGGNTYYQINKDIISIKFEEKTTKSQIRAFETNNQLVLKRKNVLGWHDYETDISEDSIFAFVGNLQASNLTDIIEISTIGSLLSTANDIQHGNQWYPAVIELEAAWDYETGYDSEVIVAVIDNGLNWDHEDLGGANDNIFRNQNDIWSTDNDPTTGSGSDTDMNGFDDDFKGFDFYNSSNDVRGGDHGTQVAGIISAKRNNGIGVAGVAGGEDGTGVKIMGLSVNNNNGQTVSSVIDDAIVYAVDMGAKIINMSFSTSPSVNIQDAIEYANDNGVLMIAASGNSNSHSVKYPASYPLVLSVGASNQNDQKFTHSSFGERLDVVAPGVGIITTSGTNNYVTVERTSYSAPIASGIAALLLSKNPCLGPRQLKEIIMATAEKVGGYDYSSQVEKPGKSMELGYGRVNALKAILEAIDFSTQGADLYMRDRYNDAGRDAGYPWTWDFDTSPDIWVRNTNDGFHYDNQVDEEIEFSGTSDRYVYIRVGNKGCSPSTGNEVLTAYASAAGSSSVWPEGWDLQYGAGGQVIGSAILPILQPGESTIIEIPWSMMYNTNSCILARITGSGLNDQIVPYPNHLGHEIYYNNNIAMNNIIVVDIYAGITGPILDGVQYPHGSFVDIGNQSDVEEDYDLIFRTGRNETGSLITESAEVVAYLDDITWGLIFDDIINTDKVKIIDPDLRKVMFLDSLIIFKNISFPTGERQRIYVGFNFLTDEIDDKNNFKFHVLQKKSDDDPILGENWNGGVHFNVSRYSREAFYADAGEEEQIRKGESVTISANQINENATYNWYDEDGQLIHTGISFIDNPESSKKYRLEVISSVDLFKDYDEVEIQVESCFIENISPNPADNYINVDFSIENITNVTIAVSPVSGNGSTNNYIVNVNDTTKQIDVSNLATGWYSVALMCDGTLKDAKLIYIN